MLILTDLDDTLFQTRRKCPDVPAERLATMSTLTDGSASGYATPRQQNLLRWLRQDQVPPPLCDGTIVPVTARSRQVLHRVNIEQAPAICANGGCIITDDSVPDQEWHAHLQAQARATVDVDEVYRGLIDLVSGEIFRHWTVNEGDLALYIVIKSNVDNGTALDPLHGKITPHLPKGWRLHRNGNNLAFLPPWLNKRSAAKYLIDQRRVDDPDLLVIGLGDSHSDIGFMDVCDYAMTPTGSQIWDHLVATSDWCD